MTKYLRVLLKILKIIFQCMFTLQLRGEGPKKQENYGTDLQDFLLAIGEQHYIEI